MWGRGKFDQTGHCSVSLLIKFASLQKPPDKSTNYPCRYKVPNASALAGAGWGSRKFLIHFVYWTIQGLCWISALL